MMLNKVSLNTIGLNRIGLNRIGKPSRASSDRPYIDPEVLASLKAVCICYGKSNDDPDRAVVKNLVDPDNPFVISNATFKLNSGFGGFVEDFTSWDRIDSSTAEISNDGSKIKCINTTLNVQYLFNSINRDIPSFKVKISNFTKGDITYYYRKEDGIEEFFKITPLSVVNSDKVIELPKSYNTVENGTGGRGGFYSSNINIGVTITQIPSFEGAFVTDGIDDLITSTKTVSEMGVTNEITIISMIHQINLHPTTTSVTNDIRVSSSEGSLSNGRNVISAEDKTGIYGWSRKNSTISVVNNILGDKNDYTAAGEVITNYNNKFSVVGTADNRYTSSVAWYWTVIANKVLTTDQINQVIAYFNLDRTLNPDILCNTIKQGITNENHEEFGDKLIDFSGNGRDIQLNNIAWKGDSGIGKYAADFTSWTTPKEVQKTSDTVKITTEYTEHWVAYLAPNNTFKSMKVLISGIPDGGSLQFFRTTADGGGIKMVNGINEIPEFTNTVAAGFYIDVPLGFDWSNLVIEQIPSHAGALYLDGVNDFGKVTGMPIYKDYTFIIDYERISYTSSEVWTASVVSKAHTIGQGAFILMLANREVELSRQSNSFGSTTTFNRDDFTRTLLYQSKYKCGDVNLTVGEGIDGDTLWLGTLRDNDYRFFNGAIYSLMSFPYSMSKFLIERQLKKHKLGTLYPNMVEFRPVINSNVLLDAKPTFVIRGTNTYLNAGDYVPENSQIWVSIKMNNAADRITKFTVNGKTIDIPENAYSEVTLQYGFPFVIDKSPQKIGITIEQDENYVLFNPVINSNYDNYKLTFHLREYEKLINIGDYIPKGTYIRANLYLKNDIDELVTFTFNGVNIDYAKSPVLDSAYNVRQIYNYDSPQEVNITIDEYIRYEDIVQPYPVIFQIKDRNTNQRYSWGDKIKVGSSIQLFQSENPNLLSGLYSIRSYEYEGKMYSYNQLTNLNIILTKQSISLSCNKIWLLDNNEPKCILSPSRLRIPNSSYKLLGYIPDISGHGNHGKINNSAYAEGSGVNEDGSYQLDGVDDHITIPTLSSGGKQVLMKVNLPRLNTIIYDQRKETNTYTFAILTTPSQIAYDQRNSERITYIDGILNTNIIAEQLMGVTHNIVVINSKANLDNTRSPILGRDINGNNWSRMRIYDFMFFDDISTDDKIKELNEYVGIEGNTDDLFNETN